MKIVIIDGHTLNPGDLSWEAFNAFGKVTVFDRTEPIAHTYIERCKGADVVVINKAGLVFDASIMDHLPDLKLIMVSATGYNVVDAAAAKARNIVVTNIPGYGTDSVAQHTFALILELTNRVGAHSQSVRNGDWAKSIDWCYTVSPIMELADKTLGIIGFGQIGQKVADIAKAFGMNILYYSNKNINHSFAKFCTMHDLIEQSDVIALHCPANVLTNQMVNDTFISKMKKSAFLVNTSRGQLIDEQVLAHALNNNLIAGAALDVLTFEPPKANNPLIGARNCIITPHNAWISFEARQRMMAMLIQNLERFVSGSPINVVN